MDGNEGLGPGIKEKELRAMATCSICEQKIGRQGPLFWRVRFNRYGLDHNALQQQQGLGMMISPAIAMIMGPDHDLAKPVMPAKEVTICEHCMLTRCGQIPAAALE